MTYHQWRWTLGWFPGEITVVWQIACASGCARRQPRLRHLTAPRSRAHDGEPRTQTSAPLVSILPVERVVICLLFSTGHFARHRTTGADECTPLHAQSQHPRRALSVRRLGFGRKGCVGAQGARRHRAPGMEDPGAGPRNEGHPRDGFAGAGPSRDWCDAPRVCFFLFLVAFCAFVVGLVTAFVPHKGNCTRRGRRCPTSRPSTSLRRPWQTSEESRRISKGISMNRSTSTFQSRFRGHCWKSLLGRSRRMGQTSS